MALTPIKDTSRVIKDPVKLLVERALLKEADKANLNVQNREPYVRALNIYNNFKANHLTIEPIREWADGRRLVCAVDREFGVAKTEIEIESLDGVEFIKAFLPEPLKFKSVRELLLENPADHKLPAIVYLVTEDTYLYWGPDYLDAQKPENQEAILKMLDGLFVNSIALSSDRVSAPVLEKSGVLTIADASISGGKIELEAYSDQPSPVEFGIGEWLTEGVVFEEADQLSEDIFSFKLTPFEAIPSDAKVTIYLGDYPGGVGIPMTGSFNAEGLFTGQALVRFGSESALVLEKAPVGALVEVPGKPGLVFQFKEFDFSVQKDLRRFVAVPSQISYDGKNIVTVVKGVDTYITQPREPIFVGSDVLTPTGILVAGFDRGTWPLSNLVSANLTALGDAGVKVQFESGRQFTWDGSLTKTDVKVDWVLQTELFSEGLYRASYRMFYPAPLTPSIPAAIDSADGIDGWKVGAVINGKKVKLTSTGNDVVTIEYYPVIGQTAEPTYECDLNCFFDGQSVTINHRKVFSFTDSGLVVTRDSVEYDVDTGIATIVDRVFYPNGDVYPNPVKFNPLAMYTHSGTGDTLHLVQQFNKLTTTINVGRDDAVTWKMESQLVAITEPRSSDWSATISTPIIPTFNIESEAAEYVQKTGEENDPHLLYTFKLTADSVMTTPSLKFPYEIGMNTQSIGPVLLDYDPDTKVGTFRIPVKDRTLAPIVYQMRSRLIDDATKAYRPANAKVSLTANLMFGLTLNGYTYNGVELIATFTLVSNNDPTSFKSISRADFNNFVDDDFSYVLSADKTKIIVTQSFVNQEAPTGDWDTSLILKGIGIGGEWDGEFDLRGDISYRGVVVDPDKIEQLPGGNGVEIGITNPGKNEVEVDLSGVTGLPDGSTVTVSPDKDKIIITWPPGNDSVNIGGEITIIVKDPVTGGESSIDHDLDIEVLPPFPGPAKFTLVSFTLENEVAAVIQRVTLGDQNVYPNAVDIEIPFLVAGYVTNPATPEYMGYGKETGLLTFHYKVSVPTSGIRDYRFSARCNFPKYLNPVKAVFDQTREFGTPLTPLIFNQKSFTVAFGLAEVSFEVKQQDGGFPSQLTIVSPFIEATNSKNGLVAKTTSYDAKTGIVKFSFDVNMPTTADVVYTFRSEVVLPLLGSYRQSFSFNKLITSPGGYSYTTDILRIRDGKMRANAKLSNVNPALRPVSVVINAFTKVTGKDGTGMIPEDVIWDPDTQELSFTFPVTTNPINIQTYQFQGETDVDGRTVPIDLTWIGTKMALSSHPNVLTGNVLTFGSNVVVYSSGSAVLDPKTVTLINGTNLMDDTFRGWYEGFKALGEIQVVMPTNTPIRYTVGYEITVLKDKVEQTLKQTANKDAIWPAPTVRPVITEKAFTINSGVATVTLGVAIDGKPAISPKLKVPLTTAEFTVGGVKTPSSESYSNTTGDLTFTFPVTEDDTAERTYVFAGDITFPFYQSYANQAFSVSKLLAVKKSIEVEQLGFTLSPDRTSIAVDYKLTPSSGGYPLDASIQVPFDSIVPSPIQSSPVRGYDKTTGTGRFTFYFNMPAEATDVVFNTKFTAPDFFTKTAQFVVNVPADPRFTINNQLTAIRGPVLYTEMIVKNAANVFPATVTIPDLTSATGTVGGTKTPKASGYDPLTGKFWFETDIVQDSTDNGVHYNLDGKIVVNESEQATFTVRVPSVKIDVKIDSNSWETTNVWQLRLTLRRADGSYIKDGSLKVVSIPKKDPGKAISWTKHGGNIQWYVSIPVTPPATDVKTVYDADLFFEFTTPEGVLTQTPIKAQFVSFLPTQGNGLVNTWLDNMTVTGTELTAVVQCEFASSGGKKPVYGVMNDPLDSAVNTVGGVKTIKRQSYDNLTGKLSFVTDVIPPDVGGTYYSFGGRIRFPEYGDNVIKPALDAVVSVNKTISPPAPVLTMNSATMVGDKLDLTLNVDRSELPNPTVGYALSITPNAEFTVDEITKTTNDTRGVFKLKVAMPSVGNNKNIVVECFATLDDGKIHRFQKTFQINNYEVVVSNTAVSGSKLTYDATVKIKNGGKLTNTQVVMAMEDWSPKASSGTPTHSWYDWAQVWQVSIPSTTPATTQRSQYSASGNALITQADGLKVTVGYNMAYTNWLTAPGVLTTSLDSMVLNGTELTVKQKLTFPGSVYPQGVTLVSPLTTAVGTIGGKKVPTNQSYDKTTGLLTWKIDVVTPTPTQDATYTFTGNAECPEYGDGNSKPKLTVPFNISQMFVDQQAVFNTTYQDSVLKDGVLTVTNKLSNSLGLFPTTATLPVLATATGTPGGSLAVKSETYDPITGIHKFSIDVDPVPVSSTKVYRATGKIIADGNKQITLDRSVTAHSYTLGQQASAKFVGDNLEFKHQFIRSSDASYVIGARNTVTTLNKQVVGTRTYTRWIPTDAKYGTLCVVDLPQAAGTLYTGNGYMTTQKAADGLITYVPWTLNFTSDALPVPGTNKVELQDIDYTANDVTFSIICRQADGSFPDVARFATALYRTYTPTRVDGSAALSQSYDKTTGVLKATFSGKAPTATLVDYQIQGDVTFSDETTPLVALYGNWELDNTAPANGLRN
jgi:hypothetical protein